MMKAITGPMKIANRMNHVTALIEMSNWTAMMSSPLVSQSRPYAVMPATPRPVRVGTLRGTVE